MRKYGMKLNILTDLAGSSGKLCKDISDNKQTFSNIEIFMYYYMSLRTEFSKNVPPHMMLCVLSNMSLCLDFKSL